MRAIYLRSLLAVFGIVALVLIDTMVAGQASADAAPASTGAAHRLR